MYPEPEQDHPRSRGVYARQKTITAAQDKDHPRSRGVYEYGDPKGYVESGSSPLARGLPEATKANIKDTRIIPARAGFTPDRAQHQQPDQDHPRSRGVY